MRLLERENQLAQLRRAFAALADGGPGLCAVIAGESGIGKTSLVQAFVQGLPHGTKVLSCGCEALFTPRPLGPWVDIASHFPPPLAQALLRAPGAGSAFAPLLRHFAEASAAQVLVMEDVHWADAGSLDLLHHLGRRLHGLRLMLVLTHRSAGLDAEHPLQSVLGALTAATTLRLTLPPLSPQAVETLARSARRSSAGLHAATGGNPFYVAEALASPEGVPPSVRDAVLGELARLAPDARRLAQWVSLFPARAERSLLESLDAEAAAALPATLRSGLLAADAATVAFRHELARAVVYEALPAPWRSDGHAAIHARLAQREGADRATTRTAAATALAHRVHHAEAAGLRAEVAVLAPHAAAHAAATGAHREAARLYALALAAAPEAEDTRRATLLEQWADELTLVNRHREAIAAREEALAIHARRGDEARRGAGLRALARLHWFDAGGRGECVPIAHQAIAALEPLGPSRELALAYSTLSHLHLVGEDMAGSQLWGLRAVEMAEVVEDNEALCHALNNVGCARLRLHDDPLAWDRLRRSLALALHHGLQADAARAYNNLFILSVVHHHFEEALGHAEQGIAWCEANGLDVFNVRMRIRRAFARIVMGEWTLADADLDEITAHHRPSPMEAATHAFVTAVLSVRRGGPGARERLAAAVHDMQRHRVEIWFITTAAALAEAAWLAGDPATAEAVARAGLEQTIAIGDSWRSGELAAWLQRAGAAVPSLPPMLPVPYALELAGHWREAADEWERLGCPYDRALALGGSEDEGALHQALAVFEGLGAEPAAALMRTRLRERGTRWPPRRAQPRTRQDPLGLTTREREVFNLLRQGLSNAEMARQLHRSERTIEHHVAAVLHKAGVTTRVQLLARALEPAAAPAASPAAPPEPPGALGG